MRKIVYEEEPIFAHRKLIKKGQVVGVTVDKNGKEVKVVYKGTNKIIEYEDWMELPYFKYNENNLLKDKNECKS